MAVAAQRTGFESGQEERLLAIRTEAVERRFDRRDCRKAPGQFLTENRSCSTPAYIR
jgi:hypothetical protein